MTDLPNDAANGAASAQTPDHDAPLGDPELAALVRGDTPASDPDPSPAVAGDPELAALVRGESPADIDTMAWDPSRTAEAVEPMVDAVPVVPVAAAVTDDEPQRRPRRRRSLAVRFGVALVFGFLLAVGIGAGAMYAWGQQYDGRIMPGVRVGDTDLGGLTRDEAGAAIASAYGWLGNGQITLTDPDGKTKTISYGDVGRGPDTAAVIDAALTAGRHGEPLAQLFGGPQTAIRGATVDSAVAYDRDKLAAAIATLAASIDQVPTDASTSTAEDGTFTVTPATEGRAVDQAALLTALDQQLAALGTPDAIAMAVPVVPLAPTVTTATADAAKAAAVRMAADVAVAHGKDNWTIAGTGLAPLISFATAADGTITPVFDETGVDPMLEKLAKQVNKPAKDAGLKLVSGHIVATGNSHEGRTLDTAGMKAALISEIAARQAGVPAQPIAAVVKTIAPKLSSADAAAFAPKMKMISSYSVFYYVIINNHWGGNIEGPATVINGTVVPAGAKFDFWKVVGDLRKAPGTGPGNAIEGGKITVTGAFGGGICTTSTTLFNAAFRAGMVPLARQNHNEYITRYPAGLDATVWIVGKAKQTMSFRNDTEYPILISRNITNSGGKRWITFKIWSVPNGRTYKISNRVIQHGPQAIDTVVKDPTKPVGYRYRNNAPADGAKVWVTVSIYDHGKLHWQKRYYSNYPAVDGVLVVGTRGA